MSDIYLAITETPTVVTLTSAVINSAVASTVTVANTVTVALDANSLSALENVTVTVGAAITGTVTVSNFPAFPATQPVSIASVTIGSLPLIAGTVTANAFGVDSNDLTNRSIPILPYDVSVESATLSLVVPVQISNADGAIGSQNPLPISGTVTVGNSVTIGSLPAISGTVTANSSNGSLTTRFGSVTTANTAFATSAVTNADRKYLLIQNVTTASNVITVGIGFTPTTTQGIQLSAGAGLTFEGNYIPTGAVNLLSSVTASCFTILEG